LSEKNQANFSTHAISPKRLPGQRAIPKLTPPTKIAAYQDYYLAAAAQLINQ